LFKREARLLAYAGPPMEPAKAGQERSATKFSRKERLHAEDMELCGRVGQEFALGTLERVSRSRELTKPAAWGGVLGTIVFLVGLPVAGGVAGGPSAPATKVIVAAAVGGLFAACCVLFWAGLARSPVTTRLFRYSGGLAQLVGSEPEPRVARWSDVRDFTVHYFEADDAPPRLSDFQLTTDTGTTLPGLRGYRFRREARTVAAEAERNLAPRLVAAMIAAYESGATVTFGRVQVSNEGITVPGWSPAGELIEWPRVKSMHVTYTGKDGGYAHEIIIGGKGLPTTEISVSGLPNGIFLPHLLAHVAGRQGVMLTGYRNDPRPAGDEREL
jgi:hypothetical protein